MKKNNLSWFIMGLSIMFIVGAIPLTRIVYTKTLLIDSDNNHISAQYPLSTNGDRIYTKDIDQTNSSIGTFTGTVNSLVNNLQDEITDSTSTNPKSFTLTMNYPVVTATIGISSLTGNFSNVKLIFKDVQGTVRYTYDDSANSTKQTSAKIDLPVLIGFDTLTVEFHTADTVKIAGLVIPKSHNAIARIQGVDPSGMTQDVNVTADGNLAISDNSDGLAIAKGDVSGSTFVSKFGQNEDIGTGAFEDIWDMGGTYTWADDNTAPITYIDSDNAGDTVDIEVQGLDINGAKVTQTKTLTGTTPVELDTPLWRVFRMKNQGSVDVVGTVQAINTADTVIYAQIQNGNNQTLMALYTIPTGHTGYLVMGGASLVGLKRTYTIDGHFYMRPFGGVFQLKHTFGVSSDGTSTFQHNYKIPLPIAEKTDIRVSAISSESGGVLNATFDIVLVED